MSNGAIAANGIRHFDNARVCSFEKVSMEKGHQGSESSVRYPALLRISSWVDTGKSVKDAIVDAAMDVLAYMAKEKLEQKSARPHFTRKEQDKIKAELGLGVYAESLYCCIPCKTKPSEDVTLSRCSRCLGVWYCSKKCQTIHWKEGGHKECCNKDPITTTILPESERAGIEEEIAVSGYASVCPPYRTGHCGS